jgi:hypothetical protein
MIIGEALTVRHSGEHLLYTSPLMVRRQAWRDD